MENNFNLLIANEDAEEIKSLSEKLTNDERISNIDIATNGKDAYQSIMSKNYDLIVLDLILPEIDGFEIIEQAKVNSPNTKFIVISSLSNDVFIKKVSTMGVSYYMLKPFSDELLAKRCLEILSENSSMLAKKSQQIEFSKEIEEKITNIFITVGIPAHIKGYQFLREAIKLAMENPDIINSITKKLYPSIAERFDTSASKVERAIRHAIEVAWNRGKIENINDIFGLTIYTSNEKPTNGEFIALVADKMLLDV
jgi:two-component system response regulator (stage 0 sporulation protein A)